MCVTLSPLVITNNNQCKNAGGRSIALAAHEEAVSFDTVARAPNPGRFSFRVANCGEVFAALQRTLGPRHPANAPAAPRPPAQAHPLMQQPQAYPLQQPQPHAPQRAQEAVPPRPPPPHPAAPQQPPLPSPQHR